MEEDNFTIISDQLKYKDNYLEKDLIESIHNKLTDPYCPWILHYTRPEDDTSFWHCPLDDSSSLKTEVDYLKTKIKKPIIRIYANGQTYTQHGDFHPDDGQETILVGINKEFDSSHGGGTEFLIKDNTSYVIYPTFNRGIIFNSKILHRALPTMTKIFRITLAIKTGYDE